MLFSKHCGYAWLILMVGAAGCSKPIKKETAAHYSLEGTWQWLRTDGGIAYHIHETPQSTGKNIDLELTAGRTYAFYTNGALTASGSYTVEKRRCVHDGTEKDFLLFSAGPEAGLMVEKWRCDTLELSDEAMDGLNHLYKKATGSRK